MKYKGLTIRSMLALVLVLLLALTGTAGAQEPTPNIESSIPEVLDSPSTLTAASPGSILIYGPSMSPPTGSRPHNEQTLAQAAGHTVTVADPATWSTFTTAQFAAFDAIVFGDRTCATSTSLLSAAEANKAVWSAAITGPIYVQGTDPQYHIYLSQAQTMITSGINFAASGPGTGLYASLSCYYYNKPRYTTVSFLSQIGNFQVGPQEGCPAVVTIVDPAHPAMAGLTNAGLSNWGCTAHDFLLSFPSSFNVLATAIRPSDGADLPFIIATSANEPPTADPNGPYSGDEGSTIPLDGTGSSDPDGDSLTFSWSVDSTLCSFDDASGSTPELTCTDDGNFTVTLVVDDGQATDSDIATVTVYNVAPTLGPISVDSTLALVGTPINASAAFTEPGTADTHTAVWDWDDSTSDTVDPATSPTSASHTYSAAGVYEITLTVTDDDSDSGQSVFQYVVVYDPSAGFVTGGGWINSPEGAYKPDTSLTGKANFGFVSKYKKGADTPTGNTEFQFHAAGLNFHSDSYEWLVVTGSDYARFKGVGTINGEGAYKFMLWAGDGTGPDGADTFRIRIWEEDEATAAETDVYDNGFDQAIGGGSIVVHTSKK